LDLKKIWLFSNCNASELKKVRTLFDEVETTQWHVLVEEGQPGTEFFLIVRGRAVVTRKGRTVATLEPDDYFGELSLLDRQPRSATVVCETDMDLLVLSQRNFDRLLRSAPTMVNKLLRAMVSRLRESDALAYD
jgi:CRP/FNR family transcriptional regulator, cyclic AMP receptor protein